MFEETHPIITLLVRELVLKEKKKKNIPPVV